MDEINQLIHKNSFIIRDKNTEKLLNYLFDNPKKSLPIKLEKSSSLNLFIKSELISFDGSIYHLTDYGRYVVVAKRLGVRFFSLCLLSEVYVMQSNFPDPKNGSYLTTRISDKLEIAYAKNSIRWGFLRSGMTKYICKKSKKKVYIPYEMYLKIKKYDFVLRDMQKWVATTYDKIDDLVNLDSNVREIIQKNTF